MTQANDRSIFMLPTLKPNANRVRRGAAAGMWNRQAPAAFDDVAQSIDVIVAGDEANVNSIPTMWAHPLSFESILPDNGRDPRIRQPLINQWRGMLAAIALAPDFEDEDNKTRLTAQAIDLTDARYQNNRFIQCLRRLVPNSDNCLFALPNQVNPWLTGYIFYWDNKSIGMTSPSTIVCPKEDANWEGLPWVVDRAVQSPEKYLSDDQKDRLSRWLVNLKNQLAVQGPSGNGMGMCQPMLVMIDSYISDLGGYPNVGLTPNQLVANQMYFGIWLNLGIYSAINQPLLNPLKALLEKTFFKELYFVRRAEAFLEADVPSSLKNISFGGSPISVILPIKSEFFNRDDAKNLLEGLQVTRLRAGTALKFEMDVDGYHLEREYELKEANSTSGLPIAEIWPNFVTPTWQTYYGYTLLDIDDARLSFEFPNVASPLENIHSFERSQISRFTSFPNHLICLFNNQSIGAIPLKVPAPTRQTGATWAVGIDFGTSFTNAYKKQGNAVDEKVSFDDLHYQITTSGGIERSVALTDNFIPPKQTLPIASLLTIKDYKNNYTNGDSEAEIIFDSRIYILDSPVKVQEGKEHLISNLKWNDTSNREPMRLFIEQFALQISAQAAKTGATNIKWALSYPTAFSLRDKKSYATIWNSCSEKLSNTTGLKYEPIALRGSTHLLSESLAVAHYFASKENQDLLSAACIDIGGGTSDISIWEVGEDNAICLVYQCSVQLAGKHLFSNIVKRDPEFLNHIRLSTDDTLAKLQGQETLFASAMDTLAKASSEEWLKKQRGKLQDNERLYGYLQILAIGIAGLHYYIGLVLQVLHSDESEARRYQAGEAVNVFFGGNGCRLLNWLSDTGKIEDDEITTLFKHMVTDASNFKPRGETTSVSISPKEEAACGLVVNNIELRDTTIDENELIAGEPCKIGSYTFDWNSYIKFDSNSIENLASLKVVETAEELIKLPRFLYWFHKRLKANPDINIPSIKGYSTGNSKKTDEDNLEETIAQNKALLDNVVRKLRNSLTLKRGTTTESIRLEPPFILALKALLEVLAEDWGTNR